MRNKAILLFLTFFYAGCFFLPEVSADEPSGEPRFYTEVDKEKVEFGGRVRLEIVTDASKDFEFIFPDPASGMGEFSAIGSYDIKPGFGRKHGPGRGYIVGIYSTGTHVIPSLKIEYRRKGSDTWQTVYSHQVPIEVQSLLKSGDNDIKDIKGIVEPGSRLVKIFLALAVFIIAAGGAVFAWIRKRRALAEEARRLLPAHEKAYLELSRLRAMKLHEKGQVKEFYIILSGILRKYLENRFLYHAPEMTTEEFIDSMKRSDILTVDNKNVLKRFLTHSDMVKFARYGATQLEMLDSFKEVEAFVDKTRVMDEPEEA